MRYQAILFDLDGTLLNTLEDLRDALDHALTALGYPTRTLEETRRFVGNGIPKLVERGLPDGVPAEVQRRALALFMDYYGAHAMDRTRPYPGVETLLDRVAASGCPAAIITNKAHTAAVALCAGFFPQVTCVRGEAPGLAKKPAPDMVQWALDALGVSRERAVYVGDSEVDLQTAQNAGLPCIAVTWGFRDRQELEARGARVFADTPEALWELLR